MNLVFNFARNDFFQLIKLNFFSPKNTKFHLAKTIFTNLSYIPIVQIFVCLFDYLFGVYGISTFVGYLMPNPFLYK